MVLGTFIYSLIWYWDSCGVLQPSAFFSSPSYDLFSLGNFWLSDSGHRKSKLNSTFLESLLKLRLFCNNGSSNLSIETGPTGLPTDADEALSYLQQNDQGNCIYCAGPIYTINNAQDTDGGIWMVTCTHLVCRGCLPQHRANKQICPCTATGNASLSSSQNSGVNTPFRPSSAPYSSSGPLQPFQANVNFVPRSENQYPSKVLAFLEDIQKQRAHKRYTTIISRSWNIYILLFLFSVGTANNQLVLPFHPGRKHSRSFRNSSLAAVYHSTASMGRFLFLSAEKCSKTFGPPWEQIFY